MKTLYGPKQRTDNIMVLYIKYVRYDKYYVRVVHRSGRVGSGRVTILPDFGGSGRVGSALRICSVFY